MKTEGAWAAQFAAIVAFFAVTDNRTDCNRAIQRSSVWLSQFWRQRSSIRGVRSRYHMLAYYVEWHMREAWRELMFADTDAQAKATREPVAPAKRWPKWPATRLMTTPAPSFSTSAGAQRSCRPARIQQTVAHLGELDAHGRLQARTLARRLIGEPEQAALFNEGSHHHCVAVSLKGVRIERSRQFGDVYLALALWRGVGLEKRMAVPTICGNAVSSTCPDYTGIQTPFQFYGAIE